MNDIGAMSLIISDFNEIESFNLLRYFYSPYYGLGIRDFYIGNFYKLRFYIYLIINIIKERFPKIYNIILDNKKETELWLQIWIQNIF